MTLILKNYSSLVLAMNLHPIVILYFRPDEGNLICL
jgi:hypothetical protein